MGDIINLKDIAIHMVNFLVLFIFVRWLIYKPVMKFLKKREDSILQEREEIDESRGKAESMKTEYESLMGNAQSEANLIIKKSSENAALRADEIVESARNEANEMIERTRRELATEREQTMQAIKTDVVDLAVNISGKILEREVTRADHEKIIDEFFEEVI